MNLWYWVKELRDELKKSKAVKVRRLKAAEAKRLTKQNKRLYDTWNKEVKV